jgi:predicted nucleic acid-binding protein
LNQPWVFLDLAVAAATPVLVSGDADLLELQHTVKPLLILSPGDFRAWLGRVTGDAI